MEGKRLGHLQVVGVRYRHTTPSAADERGLDAYAGSNVYASARVPFDIEEPMIAPDELTGDAVQDLGRFNGVIADAPLPLRDGLGLCRTDDGRGLRLRHWCCGGGQCGIRD